MKHPHAVLKKKNRLIHRTVKWADSLPPDLSPLAPPPSPTAPLRALNAPRCSSYCIFFLFIPEIFSLRHLLTVFLRVASSISPFWALTCSRNLSATKRKEMLTKEQNYYAFGSGYFGTNYETDYSTTTVPFYVDDTF